MSIEEIYSVNGLNVGVYGPCGESGCGDAG